MKTRHLAIGLLALAVSLWTSTTVPVHGAEPDGAWYAFYVAGGKAGYLHMKMTKGEENGQSVWTTETELSFSLSRLGSPMTILQKETVVEDERTLYLAFDDAFALHIKQDLLLPQVPVPGARVRVVDFTRCDGTGDLVELR